MKRLLLFFSILLFLPLSATGSGQTVVRPGQEVRIEAETAIPEPSFSWIIYQNEQEVTTLTGREFNYAFAEPGNYTVVLLVENTDGLSERSTVDVLVSNNTGTLQPLQAVFSSLPPVDQTGNAYLSPARPVVVLYGGASQGDIVEYQYDFDIGADSNGDGDPGNDIDNATHPSLLTGAVWGVNMKEISNPVTARLTVKDRQGNTHSQDITFSQDGRGNAAKELAAVIASVPMADENGTIRVSEETGRAVFYFGESLGQIGQYQFDRNTAIDANGDGNPANDVDNNAHPSLTSLEPLQVEFKKEYGEEQYVQLTIIDPSGRKGSRVKRKIVFGSKVPEMTPVTVALAPRLWADYKEAPTGSPLKFYVMGVPSGAELAWDFDGNGETDKSGAETIVEHVYETPGEYTVKVVVSAGGQVKELAETVIINDNQSGGDSAPPSADFSFTTGADGVTFVNASVADPRLEDRGLTFEWDFGDGEKSTEANPLHAYKAAGTYSVTLQATDAKGSSAKKTVSLDVALGSGAIEGGEASPTPETTASATPEVSETSDGEEPAAETGGSALWFIAKTLFFILLIFFLAVGGYFAYRKVKDPDMSFSEILDHELNRLGGAKKQPSETTLETVVPPTVIETERLPEDNAETDEQEITILSPEEKPLSAPLPVADAPLPPWLRPDEKPVPAVPVEPAPQAKEPAPAPTPEPQKSPEVTPAPVQAPPPITPPPAPAPEVTTPSEPAASKQQLPDWLRESPPPANNPPQMPSAPTPFVSPPPTPKTEAPVPAATAPPSSPFLEPLAAEKQPVSPSPAPSTPDRPQMAPNRQPNPPRPFNPPQVQKPAPGFIPPSKPSPAPTSPFRQDATPTPPPAPPSPPPSSALPFVAPSSEDATLSGEADLPLSGGSTDTKNP